jgi:drug/metabolite transporter (DMT)-like permease
MLASLLTTVLFAVSAVTGARTTRLLGSLEANFWRLIVATSLLAVWAHTCGQGIRGPAFPLLLLSGAIGFGLGDIALYQAYARIGSRLSILLTQCLAAPIGAAIEWLWLGTTLTIPQLSWAVMILSGVALAIMPHEKENYSATDRATGLFFGIIAALGQAGGAVISRKAFAVAAAAQFPIDGLTAAYQRILAGLVVGCGVYFLSRHRTIRLLANDGSQTGSSLAAKWRQAGPWVLANSLAGPALGVGCYQWALATTPTGIVLPIVATTPLAVIPMAFVLEKERPTIRSLIGGGLAVLGAIGLSRS